VLETYDYEQLKGLGGHEVVASDGEKVGYLDLVFRDEKTGQPEWLGIWDGLPDSKPRVLLPVRGVEPLTQRPETVDVVRFRIWRIQSF